ncbi:hypothetical protein LINPERHAP1_LOCUS41197 [Linum perenne]
MGLLAGARKIGKLMSDKAVECMVRNPTYKLASVSFVRSGYNRTARLFNPAYTLETPPDDVIVRKSARLLVDSASLFGVFFGYNRTARLFNPAYTLETPPDDVIVRKSARLLVDSASLFAFCPVWGVLLLDFLGSSFAFLLGTDGKGEITQRDSRSKGAALEDTIV